jgi:hypothetical protein
MEVPTNSDEFGDPPLSTTEVTGAALNTTPVLKDDKKRNKKKIF